MKTLWVSGINYLLAWDRGMNFDNSKTGALYSNTKDTYFFRSKTGLLF